MQTLYSAKLGIRAQQMRVGIIADNMANSNTTGYKAQRADFKEAMSRALLNPADLQSDANLQEGCGVLIAGTPRSFEAGTPVRTGVSLDMYLEDDGFFTVSDQAGNVLYTRNGSFAVSAEEDGLYLVTGSGRYVLDTQMNRIVLPDGAADVSVGLDGTLLADGTPIATLNIVDFPNKDGLLLVGEGCYSETVASGAAYQTDATVRQGALESSNVDVSLELTRLIRAQQAFAMASRAVSAWDDMMVATNNLR